MLYRISNNTAVEWKGEAIDSILHPTIIEVFWTEQQLNEIGLYKLVSADAVPEGKKVVSSSIEVVDGRPKTVNTLEDISPADYSLTARQLRLGLIRNNVSLSTVQTAINSIPDQRTRDEAQVYWEYSPFVVWSHPMTQTLMSLVGIDQANAASMWLTATSYEV